MTSSLQRRIEQTAISRAAVRALLGAPEVVDEPALFSYSLGFAGWDRIDTQSFDVHFDAAGRATRATTKQH